MSSRMISRFSRQIIRNFSARQSIDVHTHMYLPKYMEILEKRVDVPYVRNIEGFKEPRLVILPGEDEEGSTAVGRPIGREYWDVSAKVGFMDVHGIDVSFVSLANPWLDFVEGPKGLALAEELNDELQGMCEASGGRLKGFATLPVRDVPSCLKELERLSTLSHIKGVILGTPGAGKGLDHMAFRDVLAKIEELGLLIFLHPHYGVGNEHYADSGHSLFLALGFPFETTVCVSRLIVSGALDQLPNLKLLVAHAGAAMPALVGRLDSCVAHDIAIASKLEHTPTEYLKRMYFDAIAYSQPALQCLIDHVGEDRIMFGTDNPFFPPPGVVQEDIHTAVWPSTEKVYDTLDALPAVTRDKILRGNAAKLLDM
jgi:aminocarboxymuconate-semialdehyde decarboxylase